MSSQLSVFLEWFCLSQWRRTIVCMSCVSLVFYFVLLVTLMIGTDCDVDSGSVVLSFYVLLAFVCVSPVSVLSYAQVACSVL